MPKRNLGQKKIMSNPYLVTEDSRLDDGVWCEVSLFYPCARTSSSTYDGRGGPAKRYTHHCNTSLCTFPVIWRPGTGRLYTSCYNQLQKCWDTPTKKRPFLLQIAPGHRSVRYNTDLPPPSHSKLFLHKGWRNITSTRSWTGHLCQSQVLLQLVVAFTWAPHKFFSNNF